MSFSNRVSKSHLTQPLKLWHLFVIQKDFDKQCNKKKISFMTSRDNNYLSITVEVPLTALPLPPSSEDIKLTSLMGLYFHQHPYPSNPEHNDHITAWGRK